MLMSHHPLGILGDVHPSMATATTMSARHRLRRVSSARLEQMVLDGSMSLQLSDALGVQAATNFRMFL